MTHGNQQEPRIISSLDELEGQVVGWTFFAGRPLRTGERSGTRNTIQLPEICKVVRGKLETMFNTENWIGDSEDYDWRKAEQYLKNSGVGHIWSPLKIRTPSFLLGPGTASEYLGDDNEIYRHEGIEDTRGGSNPENMFDTVEVLRFIEKTQ